MKKRLIFYGTYSGLHRGNYLHQDEKIFRSGAKNPENHEISRAFLMEILMKIWCCGGRKKKLSKKSLNF